MAPLLTLTFTIILLSQLSIPLLATLPPARSAIARDFGDSFTGTPLSNVQFRGRFLTDSSKKGAHCNATDGSCDGFLTTKSQLLFCCKQHCRNVHSDRNHCGACGQKCGFQQFCCSGKCTKVATNDAHCGKCDSACQPGVKCENGACGYA